MTRGATFGALALAWLISGSGCAYYNAMWSAERFAKEARRLEERGREPEARSQWAMAARKAEAVMTRHPRSRWADDALVLRGEGLARSGACDAAAQPIADALAKVSDAPLRERAGLAAAQCALTTGKPVDAERALGEVLASTDGGRRSRAEYLAGRAAASRFDYAAAVAHFRRSREPAALPARARAHLAAGQPGDAGAVLDTLAAGRFNAAEWTDLLEGLATTGSADAASAALDRMLVRARVPPKDASQLLIDDGDRRLAGGDLDGAATRYRQAAAAGPAGDDGLARVRQQRVLAARALSRRDLGPVVAEVSRVARATEGGGAGSGAGEARRLLELLARVVSTPETPGAAFRAAEMARDSLGAPRLAGRLMLDVAAADTGSIFAPKALVAALALLPDRHDSIVGVLDRAYASSPYTRTLRGEASPAYAAAEDSLAREMGVQVVRGAPTRAARGLPLLTGPRGPWLDDASSPGTPPAGGRPVRPTPARDRPQTPPARPERP